MPKVLVLDSADLERLLTLDMVVDSVEAVLSSYARGMDQLLPIIREPLGSTSAVFGVKSAYHVASGLVGLKAAGYWPTNRELRSRSTPSRDPAY